MHDDAPGLASVHLRERRPRDQSAVLGAFDEGLQRALRRGGSEVLYVNLCIENAQKAGLTTGDAGGCATGQTDGLSPGE